MIESNTSRNLARLAQLKERNPFLTHVYLRRPDEVQVDIPIAHITHTLQNHPDWLIEDAGVVGEPAETTALDSWVSAHRAPAAAPMPTGVPSEVLPPLPPRPSEQVLTPPAVLAPAGENPLLPQVGAPAPANATGPTTPAPPGRAPAAAPSPRRSVTDKPPKGNTAK